MWGFLHRTDERLAWIIRRLIKIEEANMANWEMIKTDIASLKEETVRVLEVLEDVRKRLSDALNADMVDQDEIQKAHDDIAGVVADMSEKVHADGM